MDTTSSDLQVHTAASVDIEDLPLGWNKISVELLASNLSQLQPYGGGGFRDEVIFFVSPREAEEGERMDEADFLRLLPPSGIIVIGRYFSCLVLW